MNILRQSSSAQDRTLGDWYVQIASGAVKLPRFQRFEAWDRARVTGFLNTVIRNLPVGVTLLLRVDDKEQFISRYIATAPEPGGRATEHLLDGQQRLTAFWRAVHNNYEGETYYVYLPDFDTHADDGIGYEDLTIHCQPRWAKKKEPRVRYPIWTNVPARCLDRGLVPLDLLRPGDHSAVIEAWIKEATKGRMPKRDDPDAWDKREALDKLLVELRSILNALRERVTHFNLPFLLLPATTSADVALQVFVNMNTNSKPLSMERLLNGEIKSRFKTNVVQSAKFSELLQQSLTRYRNRAVETAQVIEELNDMAKKFQEAARRGEELGLSADEEAFYDALATNEAAVRELGDATLKKIAVELTQSLRKSVTVDWAKRDTVRARLRVMVRTLLRRYKYPPDKQEEATETVLRQAESLSETWAA